MPSTSWGYRAAVRVGAALAPAIGLVDRKVGEGHRQRRNAAARLAAWARANRDSSRPLAWFHAASVGEGLQAESVLLELRHLVPAVQLVYTHFSPSAEPLARRLSVDAADYLPYDLPATAESLLAALTPDLLVFSKLDLWPELAAHAAGRGVRVALVAATVSSGSGRLRWPARALLQAGYASVTAAGAVAEPDADRLARLGVAPDRIRVLGDPRFDSVAARVAGVPADEPLLRLGAGSPTLVAGSTWPPDEAVLLDAFTRVRARHPAARLILVPHEPTPAHVAQLERRIKARDLPTPARLSTGAMPSPVLIADRVGVLSTLYGAGGIAYVGGGFGSAGLHSVLEPAAWGVPVIFGPRWAESRDAELLLQAGACAAIRSSRPIEAGLELADVWGGWIADDAQRAA
ncbi:MAG TPA: glycosyltransferase N-terminal domain-containing protein, partial [Gemmatimonadales bacterium]|nr:glycosyltransferase N-terminal domain-containing protein [Gemmatimonadales bacterium]